jgi:pimeloyl-ACP methyl ester carboxylesterase
MEQFNLVEITTKDGLVHQGMVFHPEKSTKKAIIWVHGLTSKFYSNIVLFDELAKQSWAFASFNNRGHDYITGTHKVDESKISGYSYATIGSAVEKFEDCVLDIDAAISYMVTQGYSEIILIGSSTGANKVCYYAATQKDLRVAGIVLSGPLSDRYGAHDLEQASVFMQKKINEGKEDELLIGYDYFPLTPNRWMSLYGKNSSEDIFNYADEIDKLTQYSNIHIPLLVLFGGNDEHAHMPIVEIKKQFDAHSHSVNYRSSIIQGASHGFDGKEKEVVKEISDWIETI